MKRVTILGAGNWGTALALTLGKKGVPTAIWDGNSEVIQTMLDEGVNKRYLPEFPLPETVSPQLNLETAMSTAEVAIAAVPSYAVRDVLTTVKNQIAPDVIKRCVWVIATKGLESKTGYRMSQIANEVLKDLLPLGLVSLSGPNLAIEIARGIPTATVAASENVEASRTVQELLMCGTLRVYTNQDIIGVELGGALKNVLAISAGVSDGLGFGDNTKGALLSRGLAEMTRVGALVGAKRETFMGLTGVGDLFATAVSKLSRNYRVGYGLGQNRPLSDILTELGQVAEGVESSRAVMVLAEKVGVELPLFATIRAIIDGELAPRDGVIHLMGRAPKNELE